MKSKYTLLCTLLLIILTRPALFSQSVGIGSSSFTPDAKSILDIRATQLGLLIPRMNWANNPSGLTLAQDGLLIYSTDGDGTNGKGFYYWDGATLSWRKLFAGSTGDNIINQSVNSLFASGQTASFDITGNGEINGTLNVNGNVGVGLISPSAKFEVEQNNAIKIGQAYLSSGGDFVHLSNNEWYNGSSWVQTAPGVLLQLNGQDFYFYSHSAGSHSMLGHLNYTGFQLVPVNSYFNFSSNQGFAGYGFRDNNGTIEYKHSGGTWTAFSQPPSFAGSTEWWVRPAATNYIQPLYNALARVYDNGANFGFYYEGTNANGGLFRGSKTGAIGTRSNSANLCTFGSDQYPFTDVGNNYTITSADQLTWTGIFGYGASYNGVTGIGELDCGVRGIGLGTASNAGVNVSWPVVGVLGEVIQTGNNNGFFGQQAVYGWQAAAAGAGNYDAGVLGRTSQSGNQSGGVAGYYTSATGDLTTCFSAQNFGLLGTANFGGEFSNGLRLYPGAAPSALAGAIYYNGGNNTLYYYNGSAWTAAASDNLGNHTATSSLNMNSNIISNISEAYNNGWFRNNNAGTGLYNQSTGSGIFSPVANLMTLYNASSLQITSVSTPAGNLRFDDPNPYITSSSFFVAPGGAYFNSGTVYTEAAIQARGGISNDQGNLQLNALNGYANILNWNNGTTGAALTFRIGNGAGADVLDVLANGNLGIGTTSPQFKIHVNGGSIYNYYDANHYSYMGNGINNTNYSVQSNPSLTASGGYWADYAYHTCGVDGTDYSNGMQGGMKGYCYWGRNYTAGVQGWNYGDYTRCSGVQGFNNTSGAWGSLGYNNSGGTGYGGYFTSTDTSGSGFMPNFIRQGIGSASVGDIMGSWSRGELFGTTSMGELYASYNLGNEYTSGVSANIVTSGDKRIPVYSVTSTEVKVYADGIANLNAGICRVNFDKNFTDVISKEGRPTVTVTPIGESKGIYIIELDANGFTVKEQQNGVSDIEFTWIAIGKRVDASKAEPMPEALKDPNFDNNMKGVMFNENNKEKSGTPIWWDGSKIRFDAPPKQKLEKKPEVKPVPADNNNSDSTHLWEEQKKKMNGEKPSINAPKKEDYFPANSDKKEVKDKKTD